MSSKRSHDGKRLDCWKAQTLKAPLIDEIKWTEIFIPIKLNNNICWWYFFGDVMIIAIEVIAY